MEKMTAKEKEKMLALQAKYKRVQRAEEDFYREVDEHRDEILERFGRHDQLREVADLIGTDKETLLAWLKTDDHRYVFSQYLQEKAMTSDRQDAI